MTVAAPPKNKVTEAPAAIYNGPYRGHARTPAGIPPVPAGVVPTEPSISRADGHLTNAQGAGTQESTSPP